MEGNSSIVYWPAFSPLCLMFAFLLLEPLYLDVILIAWPSCVTSRQFHKPLKDNFSCGRFCHFPCLYPGLRALLKNCIRMPLNWACMSFSQCRIYEMKEHISNLNKNEEAGECCYLHFFFCLLLCCQTLALYSTFMGFD